MSTISKNKFRFLLTLLCLCVSVFSNSCKVNYSFTGASISPDVKTISIQYFQNFAPLAKPSVGQLFTESLKDVYLSQTNLKLINKGGDLQIEGSITNYVTTPVAIQGTSANGINAAASNRLTMTVNVKFVNLKDERQNFENTFSRFADFPSTSSLAAEEDRLINEINTQLVQDIFNRTVANW
jgi:hypothetical protein